MHFLEETLLLHSCICLRYFPLKNPSGWIRTICPVAEPEFSPSCLARPIDAPRAIRPTRTGCRAAHQSLRKRAAVAGRIGAGRTGRVRRTTASACALLLRRNTNLARRVRRLRSRSAALGRPVRKLITLDYEIYAWCIGRHLELKSFHL